MFSVYRDHEILRTFEDEFSRGTQSPVEFINRFSKRLPDHLQLEIIAIAVELDLQRGERPDVERLGKQFPHFSDRIPEVCAQTVGQFLKSFCPIGDHSNSLPVQFGKYDIVRELGRGGMGVIYEAVQRDLNRTVALKTLFFDRQNIRREARLMGAFNHPGICQVFRVGEYRNLPFMVMEHVAGSPLSEVFGGLMSPHEAVPLVLGITEALEAIHRLGILHLDIKPENVIIKYNDEPILIDFGLAIRNGTSVSCGSPDPFGSTPYCAPERLDSRFGKVSFQSDVYSVGLLLYELLTGRRPYNGSVQDTIEQMKVDPPRRISDYSDDVDEQLEEICLNAIEVKIKNRTNSITRLREQLMLWQQERSKPVGAEPRLFPRSFSVKSDAPRRNVAAPKKDYQASPY